MFTTHENLLQIKYYVITIEQWNLVKDATTFTKIRDFGTRDYVLVEEYETHQREFLKSIIFRIFIFILKCLTFQKKKKSNISKRLGEWLIQFYVWNGYFQYGLGAFQIFQMSFKTMCMFKKWILVLVFKDIALQI